MGGYDELVYHHVAFEYSSINTAEIAYILVEVRGFEPLTPALQTRCSAN